MVASLSGHVLVSRYFMIVLYCISPFVIMQIAQTSASSVYAMPHRCNKGKEFRRIVVTSVQKCVYAELMVAIKLEGVAIRTALV